MIGVDTSFLVGLAVQEHPDHQRCWALFEREIVGGEATMAMAPQVLAEFCHIVTDERRFERPLAMHEALELCEQWWNARECRPVAVDAEAGALFLTWMHQHTASEASDSSTRFSLRPTIAPESNVWQPPTGGTSQRTECSRWNGSEPFWRHRTDHEVHGRQDHHHRRRAHDRLAALEKEGQFSLQVPGLFAGDRRARAAQAGESS